MSDLSELLTVTHLSSASWAIHSQSLICLEQSERIVHSCSFDLSEFPALVYTVQYTTVYSMIFIFASSSPSSTTPATLLQPYILTVYSSYNIAFWQCTSAATSHADSVLQLQHCMLTVYCSCNIACWQCTAAATSHVDSVLRLQHPMLTVNCSYNLTFCTTCSYNLTFWQCTPATASQFESVT